MNQHTHTDLKISPQAIRAQLASILNSEAFVRARRMQRFLTFIVEETLAGRADQLGEYGVGVGVFDRGADFEPAIDPIVRNDARRLRVKLAEYYRESQARAEVIIEIPKGGYAPVFRRPASIEPIPSPAAGAGRRLAVLPFEILTAAPDSAMCGRALCVSLTAGLTNVDGIEAVAHGYAVPDMAPSHVINGYIWKSGDRCRVVVNLIQVAEGAQVWAREYAFQSGEMLAASSQISTQVLHEVKSRLGRQNVRPMVLAMAA
jgi:TolB-like protein